MSKIDVTRQLVNVVNGEPIQMASETCGECGHITKGQPFTLRLVCTRALSERQPTQPGEKSMPGDEHVERFQLAMRILNEDEPSLSVEELVLTRESIADFYAAPAIVGQAWLMLDPPD